MKPTTNNGFEQPRAPSHDQESNSEFTETYHSATESTNMSLLLVKKMNYPFIYLEFLNIYLLKIFVPVFCSSI